MSRFYAIVLVFIVGSLPIVSAYFGVGNFEVPGSPDVTDTDGDGIHDWYENTYWYNTSCTLNPNDAGDAGLDFDGDGFNNSLEYSYLFNPCLPNIDGDNDGLPDLWEDANGFDKWFPDDALADIDFDGLINIYEYQNDTDFNDPDTDNDGLPDGWEVFNGLNATNPADAVLDSDGDTLTNIQEYGRGTDPNKADTDGDGDNDDIDTCPLDPANGCADADQDGIINDLDVCDDTNSTEIGQIIYEPTSPWYGCKPSERDLDFDGVNDTIDLCPTDFTDGCLDSDFDGINDSIDECPEDPTNACVDSDGDGVSDLLDGCNNTIAGEIVNETGCSLSQIDSDLDGAFDDVDVCPNTPTGYTVANGKVDSSNGCIKDSDGDGVNDFYDICPTHNSNYLVDAVGCDIEDSDGDGIPDSNEPLGCDGNTSRDCGSSYKAPTATVDINESIKGKAEVLDNAKLLDNAVVSGFADIKEDAVVNGSANVSGFAEIKGNAVVTDTANVTDNATISANATVAGGATVAENAFVTGNAVVEDATISGSAVISGGAKVQGTSSLVTDTAIITGNSTIGDSTISGTSTVGGVSEILDNSAVSDTSVLDSFIDPSTASQSNITRSRIRNSIVNDSDLQYVNIEEITINHDKVQPKTSGTGKIRVENVNFTITSSSLTEGEIDYKGLVAGHKRSENLFINDSGKTLKVNDTSTTTKFAEVKVITGDITANVTVAKVAINTKGGGHLGNGTRDYLSVEEDGDFQGQSLAGSTIKIYYNLEDVENLNKSTLSIARYNVGSGSWQAVPSTIGSDATGSYVFANVDDFSIFGIFGDLLPCLKIGEEWCEVLNKCLSISTVCAASESPVGGGGGGPPAPTLPPVFKPEVTRLTDQLIMDLFISRDWLDRDFWTVPISVASALVLTDEPPSPISPIVRGLLAKPLKMLLEPLKAFRGETVKGKEAISDIYKFTTQKVLAKFTQSDIVVIAVREPAVDSMAAVAYAKSMEAPILLTEQDEAPEVTINAVRKLNPERIVIVGGTVAISSAVESEFGKIAPTERIWGPTRYETAVELAERLDPDMVVITDGEDPYQDAVLVAAEYRAPIIYVRGEEIPDSTRDFLVKHIKTQEGNQMAWVTAGVDEDVHTEIQGLYSLPEFLTRNRLSLKLFQFGTRFLR